MIVRITAGTPRVEWCDGCLTSAVIAFDLYDMSAAGVTRIGCYRACQRCEEPNHAPR